MKRREFISTTQRTGSATRPSGCFSIWLGKRERRGYRQPRLRHGWNAIVWGSGLALALTLLARRWIGNDAPFMAIFWLSLAAMVALSIAMPERYRVRRLLQWGLGVSVAALFPAMMLGS